MELNFDKYCVVDGSPTTVLPSASNDALSDNGDFSELRLDSCLSVSCNGSRSRISNKIDITMLKRSSAYQSSEEVMQLKGSDAAPERKKIEFSIGSETMLSFGVIDLLCDLDEDNLPVDQARLSEMSASEESTSSFWSEQTGVCSPGFVSFAVHPISGAIGKQKKASSDQRDGQLTDHQSVRSRSSVTNLHESLSQKLALPQSPVQYKSDDSKISSPDFDMSPGRKSFHPFVKSQARKSPLSRVSESVSESRNGHAGSETLHNTILNVSSEKQHHMGYNSQCSPEHLHGLLQLITKRGSPSFKFSVKSPKEKYVAKMWKVDNTLNWTYTFHSVKHRRNSSAVGWKFKDSNSNASMVGKMLVSCYLSTELKVSSGFMVTEFVVYDIDHLRKNGSSRDNSSRSPAARKPRPASDETTLSWTNPEQSKISTEEKNIVQVKHSSDSGQSESSDSQPLPTERLHPGLEVAAIVIQVPFDKRESLKFKSGDTQIGPRHPKLLHFYQLEQANEATSDRSLGVMQVVIPSELHRLPKSGNCEPSPLLHRWRLGGGCDCGGWDVGCPLTVFNNPKFQVSGVDNQQPAQLFQEGRKDSVPAFNMRTVGEGKYAVDFHSQLSSLQAFSICIALLHAASAAAGPNKHRQPLQPEKKIERFTDAIVEGQTLNPNNMMEKIMPSFVINPQFSPIGRV